MTPFPTDSAFRPNLGAVATLPGLLRHVVDHYRNASALNMRFQGAWCSTSTEAFAQSVRRLALGLIRLGVKRGDTVGIIAQPSPHWLMFDLAAMVAGAVSVPMFPTIAPDNLAFQLTDADMRFIFVDGEEPWAAIEPFAGRFKSIVTRGVSARHKNRVDVTQVGALGDDVSRENPQAYAIAASQAREDDVATIIYTSGSTGMPKGVALTHENLLSQIQAATLRFPLDPAEDCALSCLPLAHVFERMCMYYYLASGVSIYFADDVKNVGELLRDVKPTIITLVPRLLEKMYVKIAAKLIEGTSLKQRIGRWAFSRAEAFRPKEKQRDWRLQVADPLVYRKLRDALGGRLRNVIVGGAALSPKLHRFFLNVGIPLYVGYGLTEASPVLCTNYADHNRVGTVGKPFPGVEVQISEQGEIIARGPNIMRGYYGNDAATARVIDAEGWLHTGDRGTIDEDGFVTITGRIKELYKTSNGKYVSPVPIEQSLSISNLIDTAMLVAEGRPYVTCLLFPDPEAVRRQKELVGMADVSDEAFLASEPVKQELTKLIAKINESLNRWERVRDYRFVTAPISIETEELTPTMKVRRHVINARYGTLIEEMYANAVSATNGTNGNGSHEPKNGASS